MLQDLNAIRKMLFELKSDRMKTAEFNLPAKIVDLMTL